MPNSSFTINTQQEEAKLQSFFVRRSQMSVYFRSVLNTNLLIVQLDQKPTWFDPLNSSLGTLQGQAQKWFDEQAPPMTQIPQTYINFTNSFTGQYKLLNDLLTQLINNTSGDTDSIVANINTILSTLAADALAQQTALTSLNTTLHSFLGQVSTDVKALTDGATSVNDAITDQKDQVVEITNNISDLQNQLQTDINTAISSGVVGGAALIGLLISIGLVIADPTAAPIVGAVIAGVTLAGAVAVTVIATVAVVEDQDHILQAQTQLTDANKEVVVLNGLALTVKALHRTYDKSSFTPTNIISTWTQLNANFLAVKNQVVDQRSYKPGLQAIQSDLTDLQTTLNALSDYCTKLQAAALQADSTPITTYQIGAAAA